MIHSLSVECCSVVYCIDIVRNSLISIAQVLLPEGQVLTLALCDLTAKPVACNKAARSGVNHAPAFRLGEHAVDRSYGRMFLQHNRCNVSIEFAGGNSSESLLMLVTPIPAAVGKGATQGCDGFAAVALGSTAWYRHSEISTSISTAGEGVGADVDVLTYKSTGLRTSTLHSATPSNASISSLLPPQLAALPHIAVMLNNPDISSSSRSGSSTSRALALSAAGKMSVSEVADKLSHLRSAELAR